MARLHDKDTVRSYAYLLQKHATHRRFYSLQDQIHKKQKVAYQKHFQIYQETPSGRFY